MEWIEISGWTDAMISLAGFAGNHPHFAVPKMEEGQPLMELSGLGHPLIADQKRVDNDLTLDAEKVVVITGGAGSEVSMVTPKPFDKPLAFPAASVA